MDKLSIYVALLDAIPPAVYWSVGILACVVCVCLTVLTLVALSYVRSGVAWTAELAGREITRRRLRQMDRS